MSAHLSNTLLALLPLAIALGTLLLGRYPGERLLAAARDVVRRPRPPRSIGIRPAPPRLQPRPAIGLLSCGVTGRAPPAGA